MEDRVVGPVYGVPSVHITSCQEAVQSGSDEVRVVTGHVSPQHQIPAGYEDIEVQVDFHKYIFTRRTKSVFVTSILSEIAYIDTFDIANNL